MHLINKIKIQNYKSIKDAEFQLAAYTPLVGYNNAGKTNILQALSWIIKKSSLLASDFNDPNLPVIVTAEMSGIDADVLNALDQNHRKRIEPLVTNGCISLRRTQNEPSVSSTAIRLEIRQVEGDQENWIVNPTGIEQAISSLFPEPIFIGAMENSTEDVGKFASGTTIGKLIKEIIGPVAERNAGPVSEALAEVAARLSADGQEKDEALVELDARIQEELGRIFPGVVAKTHIQTPEFGDFLKSATIKIYDQQYDVDTGRDASSFGHGAQRSVQIALIKCLSQIKRQAAGNEARTTLLLIDEPELYLHPQAIEVVRASLRRLASEGYQVAFSTHSANMIARTDAPNALLIRRTAENGTICFPRMADAVKDAIENAAHQSEALFALSNSTKVLFCEKVFLAEGKTEQTLLPEIFFTEVGRSFEEEKLGLVTIGGSGDIPNAVSVLNAMEIPTKAVVDLDFAFRPAIQNGMIDGNHQAIFACKGIFERLRGEGKIGLADDGFPKRHGELSAAKSFELMAKEPDAVEHIEAIRLILRLKGIWVWKFGTIESHLNLDAKTPAAHSSFLNSFREPGFCDNLLGYGDIQEMIAWLRG